MIEIYTDGACAQNGDQAGGWGVYMIRGKKDYLKSGNSTATTNNIMELEALLAGLRMAYPFAETEDEITVYVDSAYICNCFKDKWYSRWEKNGWLTSARQPVKNRELWEEILHIYRNIEGKTKISIQKVAGHSTNTGNNKADELAVAAKKDAQRGQLYEKNTDFDEFVL